MMEEIALVSADWCQERKRMGARLPMYANGSLRRVTWGMLGPSSTNMTRRTTLQSTLQPRDNKCLSPNEVNRYMC